MARPLRLQYPGALYHVTARGNARQPIAVSAADRRDFLALLASLVERYQWRCYAYCLMENHYHLLLETLQGNLAQGMRQLNGVYTQRFNRRHERVGHVFQGRYKALVVERESYLLELCRYLVLNPVWAGVVTQPAAYRWSSYRATAGLTPPPAWLACGEVLAHWSAHRQVAEQQYRHFVHEGRQAPSPWAQVQGQVVLGRESFVQRLQPLLAAQTRVSEIPRRQRFVARPPLSSLLSSSPRTKGERAQTLWEAHVQHGYTLTAIGRYLRLHCSTISRIVQRYSRQNAKCKT